MNDDDLAYQIRTHLLYELKWMIFAATQFGPNCGNVYVALIDSATVHARNLFEFARLKKPGRFTLAALGGTPGKRRKWDQFLNNRVTHMSSREDDRPGWPAGLDNDRPDRLVVMAAVVLDLLEHGAPIPAGPVRTAYDEVLGAARAYLSDPSEATHGLLAALYDNSRDNRPYA
jgi:hypothetical protein